jgi:hypothetical protein
LTVDFAVATVGLVFAGQALPVPKASVTVLLKRHQELLDGKVYAVQSSVPLSDFEVFALSLKTRQKLSVTQGNSVSLWLLVQEFFISEVAGERATLSVSMDQFASLSEPFQNWSDGCSPSQIDRAQVTTRLSLLKRGWRI